MISVLRLLPALALLAAASTANASQTDWQNVTGGKVRLIAVGAPGAPERTDAALEIMLEPGWHTYWRFPGEAGIPTNADFSRSVGLTDVRLGYPAPERYDDGTSTSIVYKDRVVLPVDFTLTDVDGTATLAADVLFGVCSDICVPAQASLSLEIPPAADTLQHRMAITSARLSMPKRQNDTPPRISRIVAGPQDDSGERMLTVEVALAGGNLDVDLFAQGADGSYNEVPRLVERDGTRAVFALSTHGLARTGQGRPLTFVLVNGAGAVEHDVDADTLDPR
ncbi:protein-disulfide reductase DsbD domain-containing protein [Stappia sp. ES.058]|uniref:protein-disulfide reductase DsbD domain-containing protein n=1 Tax=Stappia sp. ES.058 TaxID=1881061 RepID=UPI00087B48D6|nr:protein-disulfide reductase DsbD domain-containing protein [Stappia sp. ES.058]SDT91990.1 Thiol-disulfide interchange protein, contains DsbC and DsbD domains [Stappia sp. ES.058]